MKVVLTIYVDDRAQEWSAESEDLTSALEGLFQRVQAAFMPELTKAPGHQEPRSSQEG